MPSTVQLDACGRRRSPATLPSFHQGLSPRNKGQRYPADPPTVEEIIAVMHAAGDDHDAVRLRGAIVVLWRAGLRISEALALIESDLDLHRGAILIRSGKRGKRREVGMDRWAWEQLTRGCSSEQRAAHSAPPPKNNMFHNRYELLARSTAVWPLHGGGAMIINARYIGISISPRFSP